MNSVSATARHTRRRPAGNKGRARRESDASQHAGPSLCVRRQGQTARCWRGAQGPTDDDDDDDDECEDEDDDECEEDDDDDDDDELEDEL